jgi:hypothetical protein
MLDAAVERAINAGRVPSALRQPLRDAVDAILASLPAPAPPTTAGEEPDDEETDKGNGKGRDEKGGKGDGGDD